jgi:hypothetical protein
MFGGRTGTASACEHQGPFSSKAKYTAARQLMQAHHVGALAGSPLNELGSQSDGGVLAVSAGASDETELHVPSPRTHGKVRPICFHPG